MLRAMVREWVNAFGFLNDEELRPRRPRCDRLHVGAAGDQSVDDEELGKRLAEALAHGDFELHYQPVVDLISRHWLGAEALCRWRRKDADLVPPAEFIPAAERCGLILELGAFVVAQAAKDCLALRALGLDPDFYISVNVSSAELIEGEQLQRGFAQASRQGANLRLEIAQDACAHAPHILAERLMTLRGSGTQATIDAVNAADAVASSLARVAQPQVATLKVDRALTARLREPEGFRQVAAIAETARDLGLEAIVGGIEEEAQVKLLLGLGFNFGQGFLFARPRAFEDFVAALRAVGALPLNPNRAVLRESA
jgi:EAL domain-containing protein (putative c-di-GMP-specific phosphodiesterase class I)